MARKRKLDASIPDEALTGPAETDTDRKGAMGGMWAGSAMNMLKQRIDDAHGSLFQGVMAGTVVLDLDPSQIRDEVGSDRIAPWQEDEDFAALVANIKRRGQTQPIRVRPVEETWEADRANPLETTADFYIQSGRRRLEACRALGQPVKAVIATVQGDRDLADLEERFHENTMRRDLNGFEELISIGLLAESLRELTQTEIAERLNVGQGDVSLGLACLELRDQILEEVDITTTPKRQYRAIIPKLKRGERLSPLLPPALTGDMVQRFDVRGIPMTAKKQPKGYQIQMRNTKVSEDDLEALLVDLAKVVMKYQIKKP
ncbi:ParB N-terminal domain-containing protein [uncultured Roseobacter sp.]|uniref:ParB N-terminal domain-containing protein n=1 Tax=uncultured Roseobacter sp. TaxID=114847 RepID=UPI00261BE2F0|nr:ParB N-terminal domain-containing protein [uncultured Roseobacter sp.]